MNRAILVVTAVSMLELARVSPVQAAGVPGETRSRAWVEGIGIAMVTPGGSAPALVDQGVMVWAQVLDVEDQPVPNFPSQDIWLDDSGDLSLGLCKGGSHADANTDADGITTISGAVFAGGFTPGGTQVWIAGTPVSGDALPLIRGLQARHTRRTGNQRASPRLRARTITARIRVIDMRMNPVRRGNSPYSPIGVPHRN